MTATRKTDTPKIFRVTLEVSNIDEAAAFYAKLLGTEGKRHPGARHYFDCEGVILSVLDPTIGGLTPTPRPQPLHLPGGDVQGVPRRPPGLQAPAPRRSRGQAAATGATRPS